MTSPQAYGFNGWAYPFSWGNYQSTDDGHAKRSSIHLQKMPHNSIVVAVKTANVRPLAALPPSMKQRHLSLLIFKLTWNANNGKP